MVINITIWMEGNKVTEGAKAVSIRANKQYIRALRSLADDRGVKVADLVRATLDEKFGDELKRHLSFFASSGNKNYQSGDMIEGGV